MTFEHIIRALAAMSAVFRRALAVPSRRISASQIGRLLLVLVTTVMMSHANAQTEVTVQYGYASQLKPLFDTLINRFHAAHPEIRIVARPPYQTYEDGLEKALRGSITGDVPDVGFYAINQQRVLVERKIAQPLDKWIKTESQWAARGYSAGLMTMGRFAGGIYSLPFAVSTPVVYFNADLVRQAGGDPNNFPQDWDAILSLAAKINALGNGVSGLSFAWDITGNWMWQALIMSEGGTMMSPDEKKVTFDGPAGQRSIRLLGRMVKEGGMRNLTRQAAIQSFAAGKIGMFFATAAYTNQLEKGVGTRFPVRTTTFPLPAGEAKGRLPGGGSVAMILSKKPETQKAAWTFLKFVTSAESAAFFARSTGYAPGNQLAASDPKYLGDFYRGRPNHLANMRQLNVITQWYAFPGDNGLKITDVIADQLQAVVTGTATPDDALKNMAREVQRLLPQR